MKMIFLWAVFLVVMISCNSSQKNNAQIKNSEIKTESQAQTSNLFGTYEGTLPAADCEGIKTMLVINEDKTYTLKSEYIGQKDATFETSGVYHMIGDSIIELVTPSSREKTYYRMLNNKQVMLSDKEGTINQGSLAEHYILDKR
ncbi:copper resistance protein NlpE [Parabacteroides merdae]|uniref:copper resistance protein NlpE n=1 Tax=Parabacteroides merdae TaxID=46503 RepID=UPI0034A33719